MFAYLLYGLAIRNGVRFGNNRNEVAPENIEVWKIILLLKVGVVIYLFGRSLHFLPIRLTKRGIIKNFLTISAIALVHCPKSMYDFWPRFFRQVRGKECQWGSFLDPPHPTEA